MSTVLARATSFAHLIGIGSADAKKAEDEEAKKKKAEDEEAAKKAADEEAAKKQAEDEESAENKAEDDEDAKTEASDKDPDGDGDDDEDEEGDDDDDRDEMKKGKKARSARLRERARCAAIFADPAAALNTALAAQLAFGTSLPRSEAIAVLKSGGAAPKAGRLADRMATAAVPNVGIDAPSGPAQGSTAAIAAHIVDLYEQARGLKPAQK